MEQNNLIPIFNQIGDRCVQLSVFSNLMEVKRFISIIERFELMNYTSHEEYTPDFQFVYDICERLQSTGKISLGEAYTIYDFLLTIDGVSFSNQEPVVKDGVINASDIA